MKTIDKVLAKIYPSKYNFNRADRRYLVSMNIFNGIGAEGKINIGEVIRANVKFFPQYNPKKIERYVQSLERCSQPHDAIYFEGNRFITRIVADWKFAKSVKLITHWAGAKNQRRLFWIVFLVLAKEGGKAYNYGEKRDVYDLLASKI